jgi:hypothetical protein
MSWKSISGKNNRRLEVRIKSIQYSIMFARWVLKSSNAIEECTESDRPIVENPEVWQGLLDEYPDVFRNMFVVTGWNHNEVWTIKTRLRASHHFALGYSLLQKGDDGIIHPVAFEGRKLKPVEKRYPTHEKELLAITTVLGS